MGTTSCDRPHQVRHALVPVALISARDREFVIRGVRVLVCAVDPVRSARRGRNDQTPVRAIPVGWLATTV
jgi:hypothetical protein